AGTCPGAARVDGGHTAESGRHRHGDAPPGLRRGRGPVSRRQAVGRVGCAVHPQAWSGRQRQVQDGLENGVKSLTGPGGRPRIAGRDGLRHALRGPIAVNLRTGFHVLPALLLLSTSATSADEKGAATMEKVEWGGWKNNARLSNGDAELIVTLD